MASLEESERRLTANLGELRAYSSFDELFDLVETLIRPIHMIGELTVYGTSLRIAARFGLEPERVYLHAGTRVGARRLGLDWEARALEPQTLPAPLRDLKAHEVEDVLCIYDSWFLPRGGDRGAPCQSMNSETTTLRISHGSAETREATSSTFGGA